MTDYDFDETVYPDPEIPGYNAGAEVEYPGGSGESIAAAPGASWSDPEPNYAPADGSGDTYMDGPADNAPTEYDSGLDDPYSAGFDPVEQGGG